MFPVRDDSQARQDKDRDGAAQEASCKDTAAQQQIDDIDLAYYYNLYDYDRNFQYITMTSLSLALFFFSMVLLYFCYRLVEPYVDGIVGGIIVSIVFHPSCRNPGREQRRAQCVHSLDIWFLKITRSLHHEYHWVNFFIEMFARLVTFAIFIEFNIIELSDFLGLTKLPPVVALSCSSLKKSGRRGLIATLGRILSRLVLLSLSIIVLFIIPMLMVGTATVIGAALALFGTNSFFYLVWRWDTASFVDRFCPINRFLIMLGIIISTTISFAYDMNEIGVQIATLKDYIAEILRQADLQTPRTLNTSFSSATAGANSTAAFNMPLNISLGGLSNATGTDMQQAAGFSSNTIEHQLLNALDQVVANLNASNITKAALYLEGFLKPLITDTVKPREIFSQASTYLKMFLGDSKVPGDPLDNGTHLKPASDTSIPELYNDGDPKDLFGVSPALGLFEEPWQTTPTTDSPQPKSTKRDTDSTIFGRYMTSQLNLLKDYLSPDILFPFFARVVAFFLTFFDLIYSLTLATLFYRFGKRQEKTLLLSLLEKVLSVGDPFTAGQRAKPIEESIISQSLSLFQSFFHIAWFNFVVTYTVFRLAGIPLPFILGAIAVLMALLPFFPKFVSPCFLITVVYCIYLFLFFSPWELFHSGYVAGRLALLLLACFLRLTDDWLITVTKNVNEKSIAKKRRRAPQNSPNSSPRNGKLSNSSNLSPVGEASLSALPQADDSCNNAARDNANVSGTRHVVESLPRDLVGTSIVLGLVTYGARGIVLGPLLFILAKTLYDHLGNKNPFDFFRSSDNSPGGARLTTNPGDGLRMTESVRLSSTFNALNPGLSICPGAGLRRLPSFGGSPLGHLGTSFADLRATTHGPLTSTRPTGVNSVLPQGSPTVTAPQAYIGAHPSYHHNFHTAPMKSLSCRHSTETHQQSFVAWAPDPAVRPVAARHSSTVRCDPPRPTTATKPQPGTSNCGPSGAEAARRRHRTKGNIAATSPIAKRYHRVDSMEGEFIYLRDISIPARAPSEKEPPIGADGPRRGAAGSRQNSSSRGNDDSGAYPGIPELRSDDSIYTSSGTPTTSSIQSDSTSSRSSPGTSARYSSSSGSSTSSELSRSTSSDEAERGRHKRDNKSHRRTSKMKKISDRYSSSSSHICSTNSSDHSNS